MLRRIPPKNMEVRWVLPVGLHCSFPETGIVVDLLSFLLILEYSAGRLQLGVVDITLGDIDHMEEDHL